MWQSAARVDAPWYSGRSVTKTSADVCEIALEEIGQHQLACLVDPVRILDDVDRRALARQSGGVHQRGQPPPTSVGVDCGYSGARVDDAEQVIEQRHVLRVCIWKLASDPGAGRLPIETLDAGHRPQQARHGMKWDLAGV